MVFFGKSKTSAHHDAPANIILENHFSNWQTNKYIGASNIVSMFAGEADPPPPVGAQDHAIF